MQSFTYLVMHITCHTPKFSIPSFIFYHTFGPKFICILTPYAFIYNWILQINILGSRVFLIMIQKWCWHNNDGWFISCESCLWKIFGICLWLHSLHRGIEYGIYLVIILDFDLFDPWHITSFKWSRDSNPRFLPSHIQGKFKYSEM